MSAELASTLITSETKHFGGQRLKVIVNGIIMISIIITNNLHLMHALTHTADNCAGMWHDSHDSSPALVSVQLFNSLTSLQSDTLLSFIFEKSTK